MDAALADTSTISSRSACSSVTRRVMILVVLAIGITSLSFFPKRIRPVSASIRTTDRAYRFSGVPSACTLMLISIIRSTVRIHTRYGFHFFLFFIFKPPAHCLVSIYAQKLVTIQHSICRSYRFSFNCTSSSASDFISSTRSG